MDRTHTNIHLKQTFKNSSGKCKMETNSQRTCKKTTQREATKVNDKPNVESGERGERKMWTQTIIKTDTQIHREKDNTLATKPIRSHCVGGIHCDTHTHTHTYLI